MLLASGYGVSPSSVVANSADRPSPDLADGPARWLQTCAPSGFPVNFGMTLPGAQPKRMQRTTADHQQAHPDDIHVRDSAINGHGLFASRPFQACDTLMIIDGEPIDETESLRREHAEANWYIYWNHGTNFIDAAKTPKARYLNHACAPNTRTMPRDDASMSLVALRDIAAGEELTLDYDYPEIYDICRSHNPGCLRDACPRAAARSQGAQP